ncbi:hypothetical protein GHT06_018913 [Daphnia sinensis]|uniref:mRNA guanylyltransferase n=1 Tax=Daphnia sinensis TaxID=1820382 RepID=A0AAD5KN54_9CRUS|nr:hypothetical protein GHT06_018913 [Daphnia sinensis]
MERRRPWGNQSSNWRNRDNSTDYRPQRSRKSRSMFTRIDPNTKFFEGKDVDGIHLLTDFDQVRELQVRLGHFCKGPEDFFPSNWPVSLSAENIHMLTSNPYVVIPKATGPRFLLYADSHGKMFLENLTQHIFYVDEDHAVKMESLDGQSINDTVLDGAFCREKLNQGNYNGNDDIPGKLMFVIRDAIRCNGVDLTAMDFPERIDFVKEEIIKPRLNAMKNSGRSNEKEAFSLDIVEYVEANQTENYLCDGFEGRYKYPMRSFIFYPRHKGYVSGNNFSVFQWADNDPQLCSFRVKIPKGTEEPKEAELHVGGPNRTEVKWETILLTDEIRNLDGRIVDCIYEDHHWVFVKERPDRIHPNGRGSLSRKIRALEQPVSREFLVTTLSKCRGLD